MTNFCNLDKNEANYKKINKALEMIKAYGDENTNNQLKKTLNEDSLFIMDLSNIKTTGNSSAAGINISGTNQVALDQEFIDKASEESIASVLVHEATHANRVHFPSKQAEREAREVQFKFDYDLEYANSHSPFKLNDNGFYEKIFCLNKNKDISSQNSNAFSNVFGFGNFSFGNLFDSGKNMLNSALFGNEDSSKIRGINLKTDAFFGIQIPRTDTTKERINKEVEKHYADKPEEPSIEQQKESCEIKNRETIKDIVNDLKYKVSNTISNIKDTICNWFK